MPKVDAPKRYATPVEQLLAASMDQGSAVLLRVAKAAVSRLAALPVAQIAGAQRLFSDDELRELAAELGAVRMSGDLLGRSLLRDHAARVKRRQARLGEALREAGFSGIDAHGHKWVNGAQVKIGDAGGVAAKPAGAVHPGLEKAFISHDTFSQKFRAGGSNYVVLASRHEAAKDSWEVYFSAAKAGGDETLKATGEAGAGAVGVFRSITASLEGFVGNKHPREVKFEAGRGEPSRVKLYDHLTKKLAEKHGYTLARRKGWLGGVTYTLTRKAPVQESLREGLTVPVVLQSTDYSCGRAAMQAVLQAHGMEPDNEQLGRALGTDPDDGTRPEALVALVKELGLPHEVRAPASLDDVAHALVHGAPCLCCVQRKGGGHWVVVAAIGNGTVSVMDPIDGAKAVPAADFVRDWWDTAGGKRYDRWALAVGAPAVSEAMREEGFSGIDAHGHKWVNGKQVKRSDLDGGAEKEKEKTEAAAAGAPSVATPAEHKAAVAKAVAKFKDVPQPSAEDVARAKAGMAELGANRYRKTLVGNSTDRGRRRQALLDDFGDGKTCPCIYCAKKIGDTPGSLEQDKILTTAQGGKYRAANLVPSCSDCNKRRSDMPFAEALKKMVHYAGVAEGREPGSGDDLREPLGRPAAPGSEGYLANPAVALRRAAPVLRGRDAGGSGDGAGAAGVAPSALHQLLEERSGVPPLQPLASLDFFRQLVPSLDMDPFRLEDGRRTAFTLAAATDFELLGAVKDAIAAFLAGPPPGAEPPKLTTPKVIGHLLDAAGVTPANPQYAEQVFRTNALDSYNTGLQDELTREAETFPVWKYSNPADGRSRPRHKARDGRYYPVGRTFASVRGTEAADVCNCRCTPIPVDKWEWTELQGRGARLAI